VRRLLQAVALAVLGSLVGLFVWQLAHRDAGRDFVGAIQGGQRPVAPGFDLPLLAASGQLQLAALRGRPAVVNFWASWCPPCKEEAPSLNRLAQQWGARGVRFVGIDFNDASDSARSFARRNDVPYTLLRDTDSRTKDRYGVTGPPETFVLDRSGHAVAHFAGPIVDEVVPRFVAALRAAGAT
jgi:cytochrome c biogenesis protein CcmG/thiol:disulfide interchange protein DsbE